MLARPDVTLASSFSESCPSSRILSSLNWSFRLLRLGFRFPSASSSFDRPASSGLLESVEMEAAVFRRPGCGGGDLTSLLDVELRESHANGPVSFRVRGAGGAGAGSLFSGGELICGTWVCEFCVDTESLDGPAALSFFTSGVRSSDLGHSSSLLPPAKLTSSRDVVDNRWAVRRGDFCVFCLRGVSASDWLSEWASSSLLLLSPRGSDGKAGTSVC